MALGTIAIGSLLASSALSIVGGIQQSKAAGEQAAAAQKESEAAARIEARENIGFEKRQKLAFLKSGVAIAGSPLAVLAETRRVGAENVENILEGGRTRSRGFRRSGRQALIGGFGSALGTAGSAFSNFANTAPTGGN